jgi:uncharacterized membrane protein YfcA
MIEIFSYTLSIFEISTLVLVAILIGMAKAGIAGAGMVAVPLLAIPFGGKDSSGLLLPILIIADVFAVAYYHRYANWFHLRRLLPFAFVGVVIGTMVGDAISDYVFKNIMAAVIFISLLIMIWREKNKSPRLPDSTAVSIGIGISGGVATMMGNLAGPIMALYLLAMRLPKSEFIGTAAWFFLIINLSKVPFHVLVWETISINTVLLDIVLLPAIALGVYIGISIVKRINDTIFRALVITMTAITAIAMIL